MPPLERFSAIYEKSLDEIIGYPHIFSIVIIFPTIEATTSGFVNYIPSPILCPPHVKLTVKVLPLGTLLFKIITVLE